MIHENVGQHEVLMSLCLCVIAGNLRPKVAPTTPGATWASEQTEDPLSVCAQLFCGSQGTRVRGEGEEIRGEDSMDGPEGGG